MTATPRPWKFEGPSTGKLAGFDDGGDYAILDESEKIIAEAFHRVGQNDYADAKANAALIVQAVNTLDEAKAVLQAVQQTFLLTKYHREPELVKLYSQIQALLTDMEG